MPLFKKEEPVTDCEWTEDKTLLKCDVRQKVGDLDYNGFISWRKGKDGQLHRHQNKGLPLSTVEEIERRILKK